jgi:hypothetical protein
MRGLWWEESRRKEIYNLPCSENEKGMLHAYDELINNKT